MNKYKIYITGYSNHVRYYELNERQEKFWRKQINNAEEVLTEYLFDPKANTESVPKYARFIEEGSDEYSCYSLIEEGEIVDLTYCNLVVENEAGDTIFNKVIYDEETDEHNVSIAWSPVGQSDDRVLLNVVDHMKGTIWGCDLEIEEEFDIGNLVITMTENIAGCDSIVSVDYFEQDSLNDIYSSQRGTGREYDIIES